MLSRIPVLPALLGHTKKAAEEGKLAEDTANEEGKADKEKGESHRIMSARDYGEDGGAERKRLNEIG